jgi:hypothetical protein
MGGRDKGIMGGRGWVEGDGLEVLGYGLADL